MYKKILAATDLTHGSRAALRDALALGSGANRPLEEWGKHRLRWPDKDLEVAVALSQETGVEAPLLAQLRGLLADLTVDDLTELR